MEHVYNVMYKLGFCTPCKLNKADLYKLQLVQIAGTSYILYINITGPKRLFKIFKKMTDEDPLKVILL